MGIFELSVHNPPAIDELHQCLRLSGSPGRQLEEDNKGKQIEISKFAIPRNGGGLLLKSKNINIDYQDVKFTKLQIFRFTGH